MAKIGRNDPCPCGSGRKYKKCHGSSDSVTALGSFGINPLLQSMQKQPYRDPRQLLSTIEEEKRLNIRARPSSTLISLGDNTPDSSKRKNIIDECARLVDGNWSGRSEMCVYFAVLVREALAALDIASVVEVGKALYRMEGKAFEWDHAWVKTSAGDIIDGNVDAMAENPFVPPGIRPCPYWGPAATLPKDRHLSRSRDLLPERDEIEMEVTEIRPWKIAIREFVKCL